MRKSLVTLLTSALCLMLLAGCAQTVEKKENQKQVHIVATLFPQYDFARQIAGDKAKVSLLLPAGVESHSYEPTPADIIAINQADLFVYTGEAMEPWAKSIIDGVSGGGKVLDISSGITLAQEGEHHDHETPEEHAEHGGFDPHIWTSPRNALVMVDNLAEALGQVDAENTAYYKENAMRYKEELEALDADIAKMVDQAEGKEIFFGGRFALHYFAERYGLTSHAAFDSCSSETEPSARAVADIVDEMREKKIPVIYYEELTDPKVARMIAEETGAKPLLLHSCHNVSKEELENGATYLSLMRQNLQNLKEGLNGWH